MFDNSYKYMEGILNILSSITSALIVVGGQATTTTYAEILADYPAIDGICFSEGELPMLKLLLSDDPIQHMNNGGAWITRESLRKGYVPTSDLIYDLDRVINIRYDKVDISAYSLEELFTPFTKPLDNKQQFFLVTSRGCPFKCSFCMNSVNDDKALRCASVDKLIDHIQYLVDGFGMNVLTFYDDQILFHKKRAKELFRKLKQFNLRIECPNGLSVAYLDAEMIDLMADAGLDTVHLAIESGAPYVLRELINKWVQGYFVVGMPGETDLHRHETVEFIKEIGLDWAILQLASPIRGTKLYNLCLEKGYIPAPKKMGEFDMTKYVINTPEYSSEYVSEQAYLMNLEVNFVHNYRIKVKDWTVAAKRFGDMVTRFPDHAFSHYCLYRIFSSEENLDADRHLASKHLEIAKGITLSDRKWQGYFDHFQIAL